MKANLAIFGERRFRSLYFARAFSMLGDGIVPVALAFAVLQIDGSATALGLVLGVNGAARLGFILVGGIVGDRLPRRFVMLTTDVVRMSTQALTAVLLISGHAELWHLAILQGINGSMSAFFIPASSGLIPEIVPRERLQDANALLSLTSSAFLLGGPVLAGVLVAGAGPGWAFAVDSATYLASAAFLFRIGPLGRVAAAAESLLGQFRAGWHEVRSRSWLLADGIFSAVTNAVAVGPLFVLGPVIAKESLGGARAWAAIAASYGAGAIVGGVLGLRVRPQRPMVVAWALVMLFSLPPAALSLPAHVVVICAAGFFAGISLGLSNTLIETAIQQEVPVAALSRVTSFTFGLALVLQPIGFALVGPVSSAIGDRATLLASAAATLACASLVLAVPGVRELRRTRDVALDPDVPVDRLL
jgi:MFS family permease